MKENEEIKNIIVKIKEYYNSVKQIKFLENELERLRNKKARYIKDIEEDNIHIDVLNSAISYSDCNIKGNGKNSPIEKGLDFAFERLEKYLASVVKRIESVKLEIEVIENSIMEMKKGIALLDDDCRTYIELRYRDNNFNYEIENKMHLSRMQIQGLKNRALQALSEYRINLEKINEIIEKKNK